MPEPRKTQTLFLHGDTLQDVIDLAQKQIYDRSPEGISVWRVVQVVGDERIGKWHVILEKDAVATGSYTGITISGG